MNRPSNAAASLGTLVHALAEENPHGTPEELTEALEARIEELGYNQLKFVPKEQLGAGEVGYIIAGIKSVHKQVERTA